MKILALDSSGLVASAAVVEDDVLIAEYTTDYKKTHSQTLLPMLDEIRQILGEINREYAEKKPAYELVVRGGVYRLIAACIRYHMIVLLSPQVPDPLPD